jgi:hypothetical protein
MESFGELLGKLGFTVLIIALLFKEFSAKSSISSLTQKVCKDCWTISNPTKNKKLRGSPWITLILILFFIVPGIIYMIWRRGDIGNEICAKCRSKNLVPVDSPMGQKIINEQK